MKRQLPMTHEVEIHFEYENMQKASASLLRHELADRRKDLLKKIGEDLSANYDLEKREWLVRSYPVLSILAPVMSTSEGKIEFPGDPMCLYSALNYAVDQSVKKHKMGVCEGAPYNDLTPQWDTCLRRNIARRQMSMESASMKVICSILTRRFLIRES
jgi:hypothetical protein